MDQQIRTPFTELVGVRHPVVQTGMGWVSGARLVSGTANAGGLGILASATMSYEELEKAIVEVKGRTVKVTGPRGSLERSFDHRVAQPRGVKCGVFCQNGSDRVDLKRPFC